MGAPWTAAQIPDLNGRVAVVTGANSGLGYETALELARHGAHTILACRDASRAQAALDRIRAAHAKVKAEVIPLDLANLASIRAFAQRFAEQFGKLDVLVNNAGVMAIPRRETADGFEMQFGTNHLGHFALTGLLLEKLSASGAGRVVTVSSLVHRRGDMPLDDLHGTRSYRKWAAYFQSKLANALFLSELHRRLSAAGVPVTSVGAHPGYSATNLQSVGPKMEQASFSGWIMNLGNRLVAQSAAMGALPTLYAATAPDVKGGEYYGPRGLLEMWGYPARARLSSRALDEALAQDLWDRSTSLTGVDYALLRRAA